MNLDAAMKTRNVSVENLSKKCVNKDGDKFHILQDLWRNRDLIFS
jgi:hypothetical protein